jgi:uncharacterized protein
VRGSAAWARRTRSAAPGRELQDAPLVLADPAGVGLRACYPLAGLAVPPYGDFPTTFDGLRQRIARVAGLLGALDPAQFDGADSRTLESLAGQARVVLPAAEFLLQYALPNFFFHLTSAYAILRQRGVALGKEDFDGFHAYRALR